MWFVGLVVGLLLLYWAGHKYFMVKRDILDLYGQPMWEPRSYWFLRLLALLFALLILSTYISDGFDLNFM